MTLAAVVATCTRLVVKVLLVARSILKPLSLPLLSFQVRLIWRLDGRVAASVDGAAGTVKPEPVVHVIAPAMRTGHHAHATIFFIHVVQGNPRRLTTYSA